MVFNILKEKPDLVYKAKASLFNGLSSAEFWDPTGLVPGVDEARDKGAVVHAKYLFLKNNPGLVLKHLGLMFGVFVLLFLVFAFLGVWFVNFLLFVAFVILVFVAIYRLNRVRREVVKLEVADKNGFLFLAERSPTRWQKYKALYPEVFDKGRESQRVEDCFWGSVNLNGLKTSFVSGIFYYVNVSYDNKGNRRRHPRWSNFFIAKLPSRNESRFFLYPQSFFSKVGNFFSRKKVHTSSVDFNKAFAFKYKGKRSEKELDIVKILSPGVQEELLKLNEHKRKSLGFFERRTSGISVLFADDSVVFFSPGRLLRKTKTNFLKSPEIKEEDLVFLKEELESMISISNNITRYLD